MMTNITGWLNYNLLLKFLLQVKFLIIQIILEFHKPKLTFAVQKIKVK